MDTKNNNWPIGFIVKIQNDINTEPDYQRPLVWPLKAKQLLIDSILRNYDIPKFYLDKKEEDKYDVIDGQQRLRAICDFASNKYKTSKDAEELNGEILADKKYDDLSHRMKNKFETYLLDIIVVIQKENEDEIRDMFLRLQNGVTLKAQEKRNAMVGNMRDFVHSLSQHDFYKNKIGFKNKRYAHDQSAAQIALSEIEGEITNVKSGDLDNMYKKHKNFRKDGEEAKRILRVLNYLNDVFSTEELDLKNFYIVPLYKIISKLIDQYVIDNIKPNEIYLWFQEFVEYRARERKKGEDCNIDILTFQEFTISRTDSKEAIKTRYDILSKSFFLKFPNLLPKDPKRIFDEEQKLAIFRRDSGKCQVKLKCNGEKKLSSDNWHCDHIKPHSKGGTTIVSNGRVSCIECNVSRR